MDPGTISPPQDVSPSKQLPSPAVAAGALSTSTSPEDVTMASPSPLVPAHSVDVAMVHHSKEYHIPGDVLKALPDFAHEGEAYFQLINIASKFWKKLIFN